MSGDPDQSLENLLPPGDRFHVFGYGSLMWRPGFSYSEVRPARIFGFHRALCVWSWVHRGTRQEPGLVFGLAAGGSCIGRLYTVADGVRRETLQYLRRRELVTAAYLARVISAHHEQGSETALAFVANREDAQFAPHLSPELSATVVRVASGISGNNPDYVLSTCRHLQQLGIRDTGVERICNLLGSEETSVTTATGI